MSENPGTASSSGTVRVELPVAGQPVLVTGGGGAAFAQAARFLHAGAVVSVAAHELGSALSELHAEGRVNWIQGTPGREQLAGFRLVCCAGDPITDAAVADAAERQGIWCLSSDAQRTGKGPGGQVVLVGGGPGDPGLLTIAGLAALHEADVVITDRLAPVQVLAELPADVEVIDVSKVPRGPFTSQERINRLLIEHARAGRNVVRFKGGDNFLFGRGKEEELACAEAGVPVRVIPGVTSAVAGPALAGIPVTHRGTSQGVTIVSGHVPPGHPECDLDWDALARGGTTLVMLMAVANLARICAALADAGMKPTTPVACVERAGGPDQRVIRADLATIADVATEAGLAAPAVTVVGEVASFARF